MYGQQKSPHELENEQLDFWAQVQKYNEQNRVIDFHATQEEMDAIKELCDITGLCKENVLRQALRLYQVVVKGHSKVVEVNPMPGGCGGE